MGIGAPGNRIIAPIGSSQIVVRKPKLLSPSVHTFEIEHAAMGNKGFKPFLMVSGKIEDRIASVTGSDTSQTTGIDPRLRRHIVDESISARENSMHREENEQELLSLSDRFGITVLFSTTGKQEYLAIVRALAADAGLKTDGEELSLLAERWALVRGGRSPRRARQFVDYLYACEQKGKKAEV